MCRTFYFTTLRRALALGRASPKVGFRFEVAATARRVGALDGAGVPRAQLARKACHRSPERHVLLESLGGLEGGHEDVAFAHDFGAPLARRSLLLAHNVRRRAALRVARAGLCGNFHFWTIAPVRQEGLI